MSLMAKAMGVKVGNSLRKLVLIKLADNANDKGECWPSYQHIADQCECSRTAVHTLCHLIAHPLCHQMAPEPVTLLNQSLNLTLSLGAMVL